MARRFQKVNTLDALVASDGQESPEKQLIVIGAKWAPFVAEGRLVEIAPDATEEPLPTDFSNGMIVQVFAAKPSGTTLALTNALPHNNPVVLMNGLPLVHGTGAGKFTITNPNLITLGTAAAGENYTVLYYYPKTVIR